LISYPVQTQQQPWRPLFGTLPSYPGVPLALWFQSGDGEKSSLGPVAMPAHVVVLAVSEQLLVVVRAAHPCCSCRLRN